MSCVWPLSTNVNMVLFHIAATGANVEGPAFSVFNDSSLLSFSANATALPVSDDVTDDMFHVADLLHMLKIREPMPEMAEPPRLAVATGLAAAPERPVLNSGISRSTGPTVARIQRSGALADGPCCRCAASCWRERTNLCQSVE